VPSLDRVAPIGEQARVWEPVIYAYHRHLMLEARALSTNASARDDAAWWLHAISDQTRESGFNYRHNLLPAGFETHTRDATDAEVSPSKIREGVSEQRSLGVTDAVVATIPGDRDADRSAVTDGSGNRVAPISKGHPVGAVRVRLDDEVATGQSLVALTEFADNGFFDRSRDRFVLCWGRADGPRSGLRGAVQRMLLRHGERRSGPQSAER